MIPMKTYYPTVPYEEVSEQEGATTRSSILKK
jgi:hypothetical protein